MKTGRTVGHGEDASKAVLTNTAVGLRSPSYPLTHPWPYRTPAPLMPLRTQCWTQKLNGVNPVWGTKGLHAGAHEGTTNTVCVRLAAG